MSNPYARGKLALAECDECGLTYKLSDLRKLVVNRQVVNLKVCPDCWVPDHPQLHIGQHRVVDPQALFEPRPDRRDSGLTNIAWGWKPVFSIESKAELGTVTITVGT